MDNEKLIRAAQNRRGGMSPDPERAYEEPELEGPMMRGDEEVGKGQTGPEEPFMTLEEFSSGH